MCRFTLVTEGSPGWRAGKSPAFGLRGLFARGGPGRRSLAEDLEQERGEGQVSMLRGERPRQCPSRPGVRAGS